MRSVRAIGSLGNVPLDVVVDVDGATEVVGAGPPLLNWFGCGDAAGALPDGYDVLGACAVIVLVESAGAAALGAAGGALIAPLGAGDVDCAVCELVEPPEVESAEPLDWA